MRHHRADPHAGSVHERAARGGHVGALRLATLLDGGDRLAEVLRERHLLGVEPVEHEVRRQLAHLVHHALRHAGGAAGVEHVDVIDAALDARCGLVRGEKSLVIDLPLHLGGCGAVIHLHEQREQRQVVLDLGHAVREGGVVHERPAVRVVQQVLHLVAEVPEVHVDRDHALLERAEVRLQVLVPVVQVQADLVVGSEARCRQCRGEPCSTLVVLAPREPPVTEDDGREVRDRIRDCLPDGGKGRVVGLCPHGRTLATGVTCVLRRRVDPSR